MNQQEYKEVKSSLVSFAKHFAQHHNEEPEDDYWWGHDTNLGDLNDEFEAATQQILHLIEKAKVEASMQSAMNVMSQYRADRINHTLSTSAGEWEREIETAEKTLAKYLAALRNQKNEPDSQFTKIHKGKLFAVNGVDTIKTYDGTVIKLNPEVGNE